MRKISNIRVVLTSLLIIAILASCKSDFENVNSATEDQVFSSREGILAASVGMRQIYSTNGVQFLVETPAITTREGGITTTFQNMIELEDGGTALPNDNTNVEGLWSNMLRVMGVAEDIIENTPNIQLEPGTASGTIAHAHLFKAMAIGSLAQNYEQVVIQTTPPNVDSEFVMRQAAFAEAITLLVQARDLLQTTPVSDEFVDEVTGGTIDLPNTINAMLARYSLFVGNYPDAITSASAVSMTLTSEFVYDDVNLNPIWARVFQNDAPNFKPRDEFGLPSDDFTVDPNDGRLSFYLVPLDEVNQNGLPIEDLAGFFDQVDKSIPVYIPDEMQLIIAEANLRRSSPDINAAIDAINIVRTDTTDPFGVNANLPPYSGDTSVSALLNEVYQNRRSELFLQGMSLEDSRRFNRPEPSGASMQYEEERNRNLYPFPFSERINNDNTPVDPDI